MKIFFLIGCLTLVHVSICSAQFKDDFTDGDFTTNPDWTGDTSTFIVNSAGQLQLKSTVAGSSFLSAPYSSSINNFEWQFYIQQNFSSSSSNYGRVYLVSNGIDLSETLNGYYLQFGEAGSNDAIELFKQSGLTSNSICRGTGGAIASSFQVRIKVLRDSTGKWEIYVDYAGGTNFILDAFGTDITYASTAFMGVLCAYTVSNASKFFFDDFYMGPQRIDSTPPSIQSVQAISASELDILFSEPLESTEAETTSNYVIKDAISKPKRAELQSDKKTVKLFFNANFQRQVQYVLTITEEKDLAGNIMKPTQQIFLFAPLREALYKNVILTEIFADPSPKIGLPEAEFVEVFNRSPYPIDLTHWKITDGSSIGDCSSKMLLPGQYALLTSTSNVSLFSDYNNVLGVSNFPILNNSGDTLVLKNENGITIDSVNYFDSWYKDDDKKEGGWSLELIDPDNTCAESENWIASDDISGGTPGKQNSVFANKPDLTGPTLLSAIASSARTVELKFDEKLEKPLPSINDFTLNPSVKISMVSFVDASLTALSLSLLDDLQKDVVYSISAQHIYDCAGNIIQKDFATTDFALPEQADSLDLIVNEVLFNPRPTGVDFVEIYNNSSKFINLKGWSIATMNDTAVSSLNIITTLDRLLSPFSYCVFTEHGNIIKSEYPSAREENIWTVKALPAFNDDEGSVVLLDKDSKIIDYFIYTKGMHSIFIKDEEGVSLERIAFNGTTNDPQNWKSASANVGFATPGYRNSNARVETALADESVKIDPEIFMPLAGQPDFTQIKYNFDQGGYVANVKIYDTQGHEIKRIANNELLGTEGFFRWDGDRDNGSKARLGYYMIWFEIFDSKGMVKTFRKRVVIASKF